MILNSRNTVVKRIILIPLVLIHGKKKGRRETLISIMDTGVYRRESREGNLELYILKPTLCSLGATVKTREASLRHGDEQIDTQV